MFRQLVLAGIIAAVSKLDALRVPEETGLLPSSTRQSSAALPVVREGAAAAALLREMLTLDQTAVTLFVTK